MKTDARALSVRQPWATLIMMGRKGVESRGTNCKRRGRVYIHASATKLGPVERAIAIREGLDPDALPRGAILGSVEIVGATPARTLKMSDEERRLGDYRPGRWGWQLRAVEALPRPVECSGALSFWRVSGSIVAEVEAQAAGRVFVYGTLKRGHGNHRLLADSTFVGEDVLAGATLRDYGAFPAVELTLGGVVHGEVYQVSHETLRQLDRLEGVPSLYQRVRARTSTGAVWVYVMESERLTARRIIPTGRWERA